MQNGPVRNLSNSNKIPIEEEEDIKKDPSNNHVELYFKNTERNKRLLSGATHLLQNPWGFENCHFASFVASLRPSPFIIGDDRSILVRRKVS